MDFPESRVILRCFTVALALIATPAWSASGKPRAIRVVVDNDYAPFSFRSADGRLQGILTLSLASNGFAAIDHEELRQIDENWFGRTIDDYGRYLGYAGYAAVAALLLLLGLLVGNGALKRETLQRTAALRESEERFRQIINTVPTMVWSLRSDGVLDFINQPWLDYTGLTFEEALQQQTDVMHPDDLERALDTWRKDFEAGRASEDEMRLRRAGGEYRWFLIRTVPLRDETGNIAHWYGTSTDIEDRKRAEDNLKVTSEQLRALSAMVQSAT